MELKPETIQIGTTIASLRKQKGLTQEQLANAVGVSTPAVSKWETQASYPDITLLAPIARALGTNVDTLLSFTPKLTDMQAAAFATEVAALYREKDGETALARMHQILCTYPENPGLQLQMASILAGLPGQSDELRLTNRQKSKELLEEVIKSGEAALVHQAAYLLAGLCLEDDALQRAQELLESIPDNAPEKHFLQAVLYERQGDMKKARLIIQTQLYLSLQKALNCLSKLMSQSYTPVTSDALELCQLHKDLAHLMDYPYAMSDILFAEVYLRENNPEAAAGSFLQFARSYTGEMKPWGRKLFYEMPMSASQVSATLKFMRKTILDSLKSDTSFDSIRHMEEYKTALALLEAEEAL